MLLLTIRQEDDFPPEADGQAGNSNQPRTTTATRFELLKNILYVCFNYIMYLKFIRLSLFNQSK